MHIPAGSPLSPPPAHLETPLCREWLKDLMLFRLLQQQQQQFRGEAWLNAELMSNFKPRHLFTLHLIFADFWCVESCRGVDGEILFCSDLKGREWASNMILYSADDSWQREMMNGGREGWRCGCKRQKMDCNQIRFH